jgi:hypothetical protein
MLRMKELIEEKLKGLQTWTRMLILYDHYGKISINDADKDRS